VKSDLMAFRIRFQRNVRFVAEPAAFQLGGDDRPKLRTRPLLSALSSHLSTPLHKGSAPGHKGSTPSVGQHLLPIHKNSISSVAQNLLSRNVPVTESHTLSLDQLKRKHSVNKIEIPSQDAPNGLRKGSRSTVVVPLPQLPKKMEFAEISSVCSTPLHRLVKAGSQRHHSGRGGPKRRMSSSRLSRGKPIGRSGGDEDGPGSAGLLKQHLNPDTAAVVSPKANKKPQVDDFEPHPALAEGLHDHNEEHDNGQESHQTTSTGNIADQQRKNSHVSVEGVVARGVGGLRDSLKLKGIGRKVLPGLSTNQVEDRIVSYYADEEQKEPFFNMDDGLGALQSTLESPANIKSSNSKKQLLAQDSAENFSVISDQQSDYNV